MQGKLRTKVKLKEAALVTNLKQSQPQKAAHQISMTLGGEALAVIMPSFAFAGCNKTDKFEENTSTLF